MFGIDDAIAGVSKLIDDGINAAFPTPEAKASAQAAIIKAQTDAAVATLQQQMSVMLAEANSKDPWTSRARPSFLYVMYVMILAAIPMGVVAALRPEIATAIAQGMRAWLAAIPDALWQVFGVCFCGYTASRGWEKIKGVSK
jgi:hypothetical protein